MSLHYNAFISYKHAELDNKVAAAIEWDLEHYHIPKKIQKKTGYKKIERIFRDKDELPITSDLSNTIEEALFNSDFLIVLCSTNTHLSTWVEREIKLFLQNHPQENVLTVLVDGEPHDVIPEILQNREVQRYNDHGQLETVLEPVEPRSCDYRLPRREAKNVELPRLAATLIGCSYNELMNRQRQYKMKRLTAVFSGAMALAVGFGAYMLYSNARINENYRQSLISQSKYLSNASMQMLDDEKRIDALHLALAALPNEETPDRPIIPEAVSALTKASLAYTATKGSSISATWNYNMQDMVDDYYIDRFGCSFAAMDKSNNIRVWNRDTHELLYEYTSLDKEAQSYAYIKTDLLLICSSKYMQAVDVTTGTIKWEKEQLGGDDVIATLITESPVVMEDGSVLIGTYDDGLFKLSAETGEILERYIIEPEDADKYTASVEFDGFKLSPDQKNIIFKGQDDHYSDTEINFYNLETKELRTVDLVEAGVLQSGYYLDRYDYVDKDNIMLVVDTTEGYGSYGFLDMDVLTTNYRTIYCIDANKFELKWTNEFSYNAIPYGSRFIDLYNSNEICYCCGNMISVWDKDTGELHEEFNVNESIVGVADSHDGNYPSFITRSGKMGNPITVQGLTNMAVQDTFTSGIEMIAFGKGAYVNTYNSSTIIFYEQGVHDSEYKDFENTPEFKSILDNDYRLEGDVLAVLAATADGSKTMMAFFNAATKEFMGQVQIGGDDTYSFQLVGLKDDIARVTHKEDDSLVLLEIDAHTLEVKKTTIEEDYSLSFVDPIYSNGKLIFFRNPIIEGMSIVVKDMETGEEDTFGIEKTVYSWGYNEELNLLYVATKDFDAVIDLETHENYEVIHSADWEETKRITIDAQNKRIMVSDNQYVQMLDLEGNEIFKVRTPNVEVYGMTIYTPKKEGSRIEFLAAYGNGDIYRYDAETGEYLGRSELAYNKVYDNASFTFDYEQNVLFLKLGSLLSLIDLDSWKLITYMNSELAYHKPTDTFIVYAYDTIKESRVGYFRHYTVEELIQKGNDMLKGQEMSETLKDTYGLK